MCLCASFQKTPLRLLGRGAARMWFSTTCCRIMPICSLEIYTYFADRQPCDQIPSLGCSVDRIRPSRPSFRTLHLLPAHPTCAAIIGFSSGSSSCIVVCSPCASRIKCIAQTVCQQVCGKSNQENGGGRAKYQVRSVAQARQSVADKGAETWGGVLYSDSQKAQSCFGLNENRTDRGTLYCNRSRNIRQNMRAQGVQSGRPKRSGS